MNDAQLCTTMHDTDIVYIWHIVTRGAGGIYPKLSQTCAIATHDVSPHTVSTGSLT